MLVEYQLKINLTLYGNLITLSYFVITDFIIYCLNCLMKTFPLLHFTARVLSMENVVPKHLTNIIIKNTKLKSPRCSTNQLLFALLQFRTKLSVTCFVIIKCISQ